MTKPQTTPATTIALTTLIIVQVTMLMALFTRTSPHPPLTIPFFAMAPFLGVALSIATAAILLKAEQSKVGMLFCGLAIIAALISFGPQKYIDPAFPQIWPAVIAAQLAIATIIWRMMGHWRAAKKQ